MLPFLVLDSALQHINGGGACNLVCQCASWHIASSWLLTGNFILELYKKLYKGLFFKRQCSIFHSKVGSQSRPSKSWLEVAFDVHIDVCLLLQFKRKAATHIRASYCLELKHRAHDSRQTYQLRLFLLTLLSAITSLWSGDFPWKNRRYLSHWPLNFHRNVQWTATMGLYQFKAHLSVYKW